MFRKKGFTLAEVLITLSIIGVIAALTMPALTKNVGGNKIGPQLAKFVNTFETGIEAMMLEDGVSSIYSGYNSSVDEDLLQKLSRYIVMSELPSDVATIKVVAGSDGKNSLSIGGYHNAWQLKDGTLLIARRYDEEYTKGTGIYSSSAGTIYVDIGGLNGKHRAGVEVFKFLVDESGTLVPYGGNVYKSIKTNYKGSCSRSASDLSSGLACTGAFADNGWKAPKDY